MSNQSKLLRYGIGILLVVGVLALLQVRGLTGIFTRTIAAVPSPLLAPIRAVASAVRHGVVNITSIRNLYVENADLKTRVQSLEHRIAELSNLQSENDMLKSTLGFASKPPTALVPCTVIGRDPEGITQTLLLSCGTSQGVVAGQGVVSSGYLIGKVILVTGTTATVRLVTAPTMAIDVRLATRQVSGVLRGSFGSGLLVDYIPETTEIAKGDLITTAGINDKVPPDILVGSISGVVKDPGALFYKITVTSPVDLRDLRYVHVLRP
jgi:rod shape-determining protein MreC